MSSVPQPKFAIGDKFFVAGVETTTAMLPCPDCLGSREWKVLTPAGGELTAPCQRCTERWSSSELPTLKYQAFKPVVHERTIGAIEINWPKSDWHEHPIRYLAGPGGGWVTYEHQVLTERVDAQVAADAMARDKNEAIEAKPEMLEAKRVSSLPFEDARFDQFKNGMWDSWYAYRSLKEAVEELLTDENERLSAAELRESLDEAIRWNPSERNLPALAGLVQTAIELVASDPESPLARFVSKLPVQQRSVLQAA